MVIACFGAVALFSLMFYLLGPGSAVCMVYLSLVLVLLKQPCGDYRPHSPFPLVLHQTLQHQVSTVALLMYYQNQNNN
jgi:hypothetical protein